MSTQIKMSQIEFEINREERFIELQKIKRNDLIRMLAIQTISTKYAQGHMKELRHIIENKLSQIMEKIDVNTDAFADATNKSMIKAMQDILAVAEKVVKETEELSRKNVSKKANAVKNENQFKIKKEVKKYWLEWKKNKSKFKRTEFAKSMIEVKKFNIGVRTIKENWIKEWENELKM